MEPLRIRERRKRKRQSQEEKEERKESCEPMKLTVGAPAAFSSGAEGQTAA